MFWIHFKGWSKRTFWHKIQMAWMERPIHSTVRAFIHSRTSLMGSFFFSRSLNIRVSSVLLLDPLVLSFYSHSLGSCIHYQSVHYNKYPYVSWIYISMPDLSLELLDLHIQFPSILPLSFLKFLNSFPCWMFMGYLLLCISHQDWGLYCWGGNISSVLQGFSGCPKN